MARKPRILLTNDDGIEAEPIWLLKKKLSALGRCEVVAPRLPRSAWSHAVSLKDPIRCHKIDKGRLGTGYAVDGTPADAIKFSLCELFKGETFDLVVSGINLGPNTGVSVYYSGTIGAAREGVISGIPGFAVSIAASKWGPFDHALTLTKRIASRYLAKQVPADLFLNINIPGVAASEIRGIKVTRQAPSKFVEVFHKERQGGETHFKLQGEILVLTQDGGTDQEALSRNYVAVTPLLIDMTHYDYMRKTEQMIEGFSARAKTRR